MFCRQTSLILQAYEYLGLIERTPEVTSLLPAPTSARPVKKPAQFDAFKEISLDVHSRKSHNRQRPSQTPKAANDAPVTAQPAHHEENEPTVKAAEPKRPASDHIVPKPPVKAVTSGMSFELASEPHDDEESDVAPLESPAAIPALVPDSALPAATGAPDAAVDESGSASTFAKEQPVLPQKTRKASPPSVAAAERSVTPNLQKAASNIAVPIQKTDTAAPLAPCVSPSPAPIEPKATKRKAEEQISSESSKRAPEEGIVTNAWLDSQMDDFVFERRKAKPSRCSFFCPLY